MALTANSTAAEIRAEYRTCSSYDVDGDAALARRFVVACRYWLAFPKRTARESESLDLSHEQVQRQLDAALEWLQANGGVSGNEASRTATLCALGRTRW